MNNKTKGVVFALLATLLWSVNMVIASSIKGHIPPIGLAFWRWCVACLAFALFAFKSTVAQFSIVKKNWLYLFCTAILGITIFNTLIYFAGKTTSAINLSLIAISIPLFIIFLSRIFLKERISTLKLVGIATIICGVLVLISKGSWQALRSISFSFGDILMLIACFFFASYTLLVRKKPTEIDSKVFLFSVFVMGTVALFPFYLYEHWYITTVQFDTKTILVLLYVGIFASLVSFYLWNEAIVLIGTAKTALIYYLIPVFSGLIAYLITDQPILQSQLISMLIIITGLLLTNKSSN
ncbi:DMT family transporter [Flavobacterium turcicum]|uniref:DMT family transporter n=1 Tax=Flavobacterium turcicum TaxID=2764718 RepID=A0ABR7JIU4_9FLAO|nr:DMT family transporter [Flavobacterium turcicum]MBC5864422.1 DMT family transporter [Flavobacterium turcicum]NHL03190.1 DMT family transporter [Flavobacterium turcicum]